MCRVSWIASFGLVLVSFCRLAAADWTTFLATPGRTGARSARLPKELGRQWTWRAQRAPDLAFEGPRNDPIEGHNMRHRISFDDAIQPIIADGRVYVGSMIDHAVYCLDLHTGDTLWRVTTGAPVRTVPTYTDGRLYVGSDDGFAYCLDAKTGEEIWKCHPGPRQEWLLARGRMISRWPIRTGVLVEDGTAYLGAGIFPHEKVFLVALDARTGCVIWRNDTLSNRDAGRDDLSPQGYLAITGDTLIVPSGRSMPAAFDKKTGDFLQKHFNWWRGLEGVVGGWHVLGHDGLMLASGRDHFWGVPASSDQTDVAWLPRLFDGERGSAFIPGRRLVIDGDIAFTADGKYLSCIDFKEYLGTALEARKLTDERKKLPHFQDRNDASKEKRRTEIDVRLKQLAGKGFRWRVPCPELQDVMIATHDKILIGGLNEFGDKTKVGAVEIYSRDGERIGAVQTTGRARGLAAVDGHLVTSCTEGEIQVFAAKANKNIYAHTLPKTPWHGYSDDHAATLVEPVRKFLPTGEASILTIGVEPCGSFFARSLEGMRRYFVLRDANKVAWERTQAIEIGGYGDSIHILQAPPKGPVPLPNFFCNVVIDPRAFREREFTIPLDELIRFVKPCGGYLVMRAWDYRELQRASEPPGWLEQFTLEDDATVNHRVVFLRRGKLPGSGEWTHQYANPGNTACSGDDRVAGPLGVLWYGDPGPQKTINRHEAAHAPLVANGRMFVQGLASIRCYDIYNGQFYWEYKNPGAKRAASLNNEDVSNMAATDDYLFMVADDFCEQIDAATGKLVATHRLPEVHGTPEEKESRVWGYLGVVDGLLLGTNTQIAPDARRAARRGAVMDVPSDTLFAIDISSGKPAWKYQGKSLMHVTVTAGDDRIFFVDSSITPKQRAAMLAEDKSELEKLSGPAREQAEAEIKRKDVRLAVALDATTGKPLWSKPVDVTDCSRVGIGSGNLTMMYHNGKLVLCGANANGHFWKQFLSGDFSRRRLVVLDAATGEKAWAKDANYRTRPIIVGNEIIAEPWAFDLNRGYQKTRANPITGKDGPWQFVRPGHHCGAIAASSSMLFYRSWSMAYLDLNDDSGTRHFAGHRLGCWINQLPAGGVLVVPEASAGCVCSFSIAATVVMEPRPDREPSPGLFSAAGPTLPVNTLAINLAGGGDRHGKDGTLWFAYPRPEYSKRLEFEFNIDCDFAEGGGYTSESVKLNPVTQTDDPWLYTTQATGVRRLVIPLRNGEESDVDGVPGNATYTVRLHFAPLNTLAPPAPFDIVAQGRIVAPNVRLPTASDKTCPAIVKRFKDIVAKDRVTIEFRSRGGGPAANIAAIQITRETE